MAEKKMATTIRAVVSPNGPGSNAPNGLASSSTTANGTVNERHANETTSNANPPPTSQAFGIHPLHLGMIFLTNLELGYLTPPLGLNLFLAAYRFDKPVVAIYRSAVPFLLVLALVVLLVTYVPVLTLGIAGAE